MSGTIFKLIKFSVRSNSSLYSVFRPYAVLISNSYYAYAPGLAALQRFPKQKVVFCGIREYGQESKSVKDSAVSTSVHDSQVSTSVKETIKETTKTASYMGVILVGIAVTSVMFYTIFSELFSSKSPNTVYSNTLKKCANDNRIKDSLGEPIKGFGEETRRGRRRYTTHVIYEKDGVEHMRMKFYLKGIRNTATVHLEMKEGTKGHYEYRYLFVQLDDLARRVIVLEDNRQEKTVLPLIKDQYDFQSSPLTLS